MFALEQALVAAIEAGLAAGSYASTKVYEGQAPEGEAFPYIVFQQVTGVPEYTFTQKAITPYVYDVAVHDEGHNQQRADAIRAEVMTALDLQPLTIQGHTHSRTQLDREFNLSTRDQGKSYKTRGATFRIWVKP